MTELIIQLSTMNSAIRLIQRLAHSRLQSYSYGANNGPILSSTYGTGQNVSYAYDEFGNVKTRKYNGKTAFNWYSDRGGNIIRENDYLNKRLTDFTYDTTGQTCSSDCC